MHSELWAATLRPMEASTWASSLTVNVFDSSGTSTEPVPEPGTLVLLGAVGAFVAIRRIRRR